MTTYRLLDGDCVERMAELPDSSVDSIVTDPPYGLGFMGKKWDIGVPAVDVFRECLRVLKPGGHLLAFGGSRTYHRLAVAVEDAGFEIRDQIMWVYGSGFPKSQNVSKAIDKAAGAEREVVGPRVYADGTVGHWANGDCYAQDAHTKAQQSGAIKMESIPATDAARQWDGWGTALKPAHEPIVVARKPLIGTVAANVLEHGTGALNIDGCRVPSEGGRRREGEDSQNRVYRDRGATDFGIPPGPRGGDPQGRWPANLIHDGSDEVLAAFPDAKGQQGALTGNEPSGKMGRANCYGVMDRRHEAVPRIDSSTSAARFFYCAKASKKDRNEGLDDAPDQILARSCQAAAEAKRGNTVAQSGGAFNKARVVKNNHPTVKPTDLMRYLCRLVTPPGGTVLDPFAGSGSTGKAAIREGFDFIGIEKEAEYLPIIRARLEHAGGIDADTELGGFDLDFDDFDLDMDLAV